MSKRARETPKQRGLARRQRFNSPGQDQDHAGGYNEGDDSNDGEEVDDEDGDGNEDGADYENGDDDEDDDSVMNLTDVDQESANDESGNDPQQTSCYF